MSQITCCDEVFDHAHQFVNPIGTTVMVWIIEGEQFTSLMAAVRTVESLYGVTYNEATKYLKDLPKRFN